MNFLLPLAGIHGALLSAVRSMDDDICRIVDIRHEGRSTPVEFEWIGVGRSLEDGGRRGAHNTSVDAFLVAETVDGRMRAYLFEWKYAEQYLRARPDFKGEGRSGDTRRRRYADLYHASYSSFDTTVVPNMDEFLYEPFYQVMRQRLLADRMVRQGELGVDEEKVVIVVPERNWPYRSVAAAGRSTSPPLAARFPRLRTVESVMRAALRDPAAQFDMIAPADMLGAVHRDHPVETAPWASYWRERYRV